MKTYKVDLDYEASLFDLNYNADSTSSRRIIREFEYVFFLIEKHQSILKNYKDYERKYLDYLKNLGFIIPDLNPKAESFEFWWGHHHDRQIEQKLNSKLTSSQMAALKGWGFQEGAIVTTVRDVRNHLKNFSSIESWIIKKPHSFSGIGHFKFGRDVLDEAVLGKVLTEPCLLEPVYERVFDIGTTFVINNSIIEKKFMVENFNSKAGGFLGGAGSNDVDKFKKYILGKYDFDLGSLEEITNDIAKEYLKLGAISNVQIDSFIYKENGKLKLYPLVEVNYRKTMGLVIQSLAEKYPNATHIEWKVEPAKTSSLINSDEWIKLSPEGNHFHSFFKTFP